MVLIFWEKNPLKDFRALQLGNTHVGLSSSPAFISAESGLALEMGAPGSCSASDNCCCAPPFSPSLCPPPPPPHSSQAAFVCLFLAAARALPPTTYHSLRLAHLARCGVGTSFRAPAANLQQMSTRSMLQLSRCLPHSVPVASVLSDMRQAVALRQQPGGKTQPERNGSGEENKIKCGWLR